MNSDELLDIVNEKDQVIGQKYRSEIYAQNLSYFRVINGFLINSKKQLWIPRRCSHKSLFPLCLDVSVGGHVAAGEGYDQAFERELQEELNMVDYNYEVIAKISPLSHAVSAFMHIYIIYTNDTPHFNTHDFLSGEWISIEHLEEKIRSGESVKPDLPPLVRLLKEVI